MNYLYRFNNLLAFLLVLSVRYVGSEESKSRYNVISMTQNKNEIEYHNYHNVFEEDNINISLTCNTNEWICEGKCVHKREYCVENSQCHPSYPIPCGDKVRCYRQVYFLVLFKLRIPFVILLLRSLDIGSEYIIRYSHGLTQTYVDRAFKLDLVNKMV